MSQYNLVICHVPEHQGTSDFVTIRHMMIGRASDIVVHIVSSTGATPAGFWQKLAEKPTLIFSVPALRIDALVRGARLISEPLTRLEEMKLLARAGATVPETQPITAKLALDEGQWGAFTVVKPNRGRGVRLLRTRNLRWINTTILPKDDPRHGQELLAQRFIDTGPFATSYRVLTLLGRPIYCVRSTAAEKRPDLDAGGTNALDIAISGYGMARKMALSNDSDVIALATSLHAALPRLPVMGLDIVREADTGRLHVLEFNSHGLVWHLSSPTGLSQQREHGVDYYRQFNALSTIADALIKATREYAR